MNKERLKIIVDEWYNYINKIGLEDLEIAIQMPIKNFVMQLIENVYNYYKDYITYIPVDSDMNLEYILKSDKGAYSLENFLINRMLRNISSISYGKKNSDVDINYNYEFGEITLDKEHISKELGSVYQRRKELANGFLHGLKTQLFGHNIYRSSDYYHLKENIKAILRDEVNDFVYFEGSGNNKVFSHIGLLRLNDPLNIQDMSDAFNEVDSVRLTGDKFKQMIRLNSGLCMSLDNIESPNTFLTNYAYILEKLFDKKILFEGMYLKPEIFTNEINKLYNHIFQENYFSSKNAIEIIIEQLDKIKKDPNNTNNHLQLLEAIHECLEQNSILNNQDENIYENNIMCLGYYGLLDYKEKTLKPYGELSYCKEYETIREKRIKNNQK